VTDPTSAISNFSFLLSLPPGQARGLRIGKRWRKSLHCLSAFRSRASDQQSATATNKNPVFIAFRIPALPLLDFTGERAFPGLAPISHLRSPISFSAGLSAFSAPRT
jgi:hypothetical protein